MPNHRHSLGECGLNLLQITDIGSGLIQVSWQRGNEVPRHCPPVPFVDPLTNEEVDFTMLKKYLSTNLLGITVNLQEGQIENAIKQFEGFDARFQTWKDTCEECHGVSGRKYYVDESIQVMINQLGQALKDPSHINPQQLQELMMGIGVESCGKCHLVHVPAALTKRR